MDREDGSMDYDELMEEEDADLLSGGEEPAHDGDSTAGNIDALEELDCDLSAYHVFHEGNAGKLCLQVIGNYVFFIRW